jgi:hypothetical protein
MQLKLGREELANSLPQTEKIPLITRGSQQ